MNDVDIIIVAPESLDYPVFRDFLHKIRRKFNKIFYVFTESSGKYNYSDFIKKDLLNIEFIHSHSQSNKDWRDIATNAAIDRSSSDRILFIEPDFKIQLEDLYKLPNKCDVVSYYDSSGRIWPSFLCVKRSILNKTDRNFSAGQFDDINKLDITTNPLTIINKKNELVDHFGKFTSDLLSVTKDFYFLNDNNVDFYHYAGITHNFNLLRDLNLNYIHKPSEFLNYLKDNLNINILKDTCYIEESNRYIDILENKYYDV
jgi:hypothetical protein